MSTRLVIVGGVAGGATAAARARPLDEAAEITLLGRGPCQDRRSMDSREGTPDSPAAYPVFVG